MSLATGSTLGPYQIVSPLGRGGMGVVYQAHDPRLKRTVAIKLLPPELTTDETSKRRFIHEAQTASSLDHPNICTIFEISETADGQLYLVMAHYAGETLEQRVSRGPLPLDDALDLIAQVGEGLAEAHKAGIVHRDIKPANLLITQTGTAKILDFGLAKLPGAEGVTQPGVAMGTVAYMSPEQAKGGRVDHRTDIWSLGAVLYETLTGTPPFEGENLLALVDAVVHTAPAPLTGAAASLNAVLARTLAKDPDQRYPSVDVLLADVRVPRDDTRTFSVPHAAVPSIAVLPFDNMSADPEQRYFCEGMAEEIINGLTQLEGLHVASRISAFHAKMHGLDIEEISRRLKVGAVLEGSVRRAGDRVRITAQLIDARTGYHLWSDRYDRNLSDALVVQDEIAAAVVRHLKVRLLGAPPEPAILRPTKNFDAYQCYAKGRHFRFTRYDIIGASRWYQKAIEHDPTYAAAHGGLAETIAQASFLLMLPPQDAAAKARAAAAEALRLDSGSSDVHLALGKIHFFFDWAWEEADRAFRRSLDLNPANVEALCGYALFLVYQGRHDEALREVTRARGLDPLSAYAAAVHGLVLWIARRYDDAKTQCDEALELVPTFTLALWYLAMIHLTAGRFDAARTALDTVAAPAAQSTLHQGILGIALAHSGGIETARQIRHDLTERSRTEYVTPLALAFLAAAAGEVDEAFRQFERAYEERSPGLVYLQHPNNDPIRSDPRFGSLLARLKLPGGNRATADNGRAS